MRFRLIILPALATIIIAVTALATPLYAQTVQTIEGETKGLRYRVTKISVDGLPLFADVDNRSILVQHMHIDLESSRITLSRFDIVNGSVVHVWDASVIGYGVSKLAVCGGLIWFYYLDDQIYLAGIDFETGSIVVNNATGLYGYPAATLCVNGVPYGLYTDDQGFVYGIRPSEGRFITKSLGINDIRGAATNGTHIFIGSPPFIMVVDSEFNIVYEKSGMVLGFRIAGGYDMVLGFNGYLVAGFNPCATDPYETQLLNPTDLSVVDRIIGKAYAFGLFNGTKVYALRAEYGGIIVAVNESAVYIQDIFPQENVAVPKVFMLGSYDILILTYDGVAWIEIDPVEPTTTVTTATITTTVTTTVATTVASGDYNIVGSLAGAIGLLLSSAFLFVIALIALSIVERMKVFGEGVAGK